MGLLNRLAAVSIAALACGAGFGLSGFAKQNAPGAHAAGAGPEATDADCSQLAAVQLDHVEIQSAAVQPANAVVPGARRPDMTSEPNGAPISGLAAFCRVVGASHPVPGSDIRFEVWLPMQWNGRLFGANNGGGAGHIRYDDLAAAIMNGGVGAATNGGHYTAERNWTSARPESIKDYGWRSIHETTVIAKALIGRFYGRKPDHSYFVGCSNGGRMALMEASRFPDDYDGIVAGAPVSSGWSGAGMTGLNVVRAQQPPGAAIRPEQASLLQSEVRRQCDKLDGVEDGIVVNPRACHFDYTKLACGVSSSPLCFSPAQVTALRRIVGGPHDSAGRQVSPGFPLSGGEVGLGNVGWDMVIMSPRQSVSSLAFQLTSTPVATAETFNFDTDPARLRAALTDLDPQPDLRSFFARGGKLIIWHGWSDPLLSPDATLAYRQAVLQRSGPKAAKQMRLFMIPGVSHCAGGPGADSFGQIGAAPAGAAPDRNVAAAVVDWVEQGRTPESLIGQHGTLPTVSGAAPKGPHFERLHCAYPAEPVLRSGADVDSAASYSCRTTHR